MSTKTDLSRWFKLNNKLMVTKTTSKFFGCYCHKTVWKLPKAYILSLYSDQKQIINKANVGADNDQLLAQLLMFNQTIKNTRYDLRHRTEGETLSIFSDNIDQLYEISTYTLGKYASSLKLLSTVYDDQHQQALNNNMIIMRKPNGYKYRVYLRNSIRVDPKEIHALGQYLKALGDQVKITKNLLGNLTAETKYLYGVGYFYINDLRILDLIRLIIPNIIRSVQEIAIH